jgi:hypothetical protein
MCSLTRLALVGALIVLTTKSCGRPRFSSAARKGDKGSQAA